MSTTGIGMLLYSIAADAIPLIAYLFVIGFFLQGGFTGLYAVSAKLYPAEVRSTGVGWAIGLGRFGAVIGPYVGGVLIANGFDMAFNFMMYAIPTLLAGVFAWRLKIE